MKKRKLDNINIYVNPRTDTLYIVGTYSMEAHRSAYNIIKAPVKRHPHLKDAIPCTVFYKTNRIEMELSLNFIQ